MKKSIIQTKHCIDALNPVGSATLTSALPGEKQFGIAFVGDYVNRVLNKDSLSLDLSPFIHRAFTIQTAQETSFLHAGDLDFVFLIADLETDLSLAVLVATTLQAQSVFTCCIALSPTNSLGAQPLVGVRRNAETYRNASKAVIPLSWGGDQAGINNAIRVCISIAKSALDGSLIGIDFEDLCAQIFRQGCECAYESGEHLLVDTSQPLPGPQWLNQATAALVIVETPALNMHGIARIARNSMSLVRAQMQPNAFVIYAATVNNSLQSHYTVSVLATKNRGE